ncbi:MAG: acetyl-CoA carboxylase biotin carboxylase subunit [Coriobacteriales bacterium]|nr:acetyl-CoA carboxylase biotin carboxylase subunit [Coriobacteriales bacterium]
MFSRVLVANRGEIALRVVRALHELGVEAVVAHSLADRDTRAVQEADIAVCIGPAQSAQSYLSIPAVIGAANAWKCEAVHPGYGFLSENSEFARACAANGLVFIGPDADVIDRMGEKSNAKQTMKAAGVPTVPGSDGEADTLEEAFAVAEEIGYPLLIKASAGGGGKGMREAWSKDELERAYTTARSESRVAFGNDAVYMERLVQKPRHVEVQVLADKFGNAIHLCERDCSVQRRHQKLIEEAPSPALTPELRQRMGEAAVRAVKEVGYTNAGTIEFLLDADGSFYFMEMNTRIQVEHPVTEQITLTDLVKEQIRIAAGEPMTIACRAPFSPCGHAFEFRINAEDTNHNFRPCPGTLKRFVVPGGPGVRVDTHAYEGYAIPPTYDSLVAKLIVWGSSREEALARAERALKEFQIEGIETTIPFHLAALQNEAFRKGEVYTDFIPTYLPGFLA